MPKLRRRETEGEIQAQRRRKKGTESKRVLYCGTPKRVKAKLQGSRDWPTERGQPRAGLGVGDAARKGSDGASRGRLGHETGIVPLSGAAFGEKSLPACLCLLSSFRSLSLFCVSHPLLCPRSVSLSPPRPRSDPGASLPRTNARRRHLAAGPSQGRRNGIASGFPPAPLGTAKERSSRKTRLHVRLSPWSVSPPQAGASHICFPSLSLSFPICKTGRFRERCHRDGETPVLQATAQLCQLRNSTFPLLPPP